MAVPITTRDLWYSINSDKEILILKLVWFISLIQTVFLSKVGDTSLDLPEATCLIQISSQFGSRRQEAQRMGRILRAKRRNEAGFRSRFYTLVSRDTDEVAFSHKRKRFLIDQGYEFKVVHDLGTLISPEEMEGLKYSGEKEQDALLRAVLKESDAAAEDEVLNSAVDDIAGAWQSLGKKKKGSLEEKVRRDKVREKAQGSNPLFKTWLKK
jgi:DNA excision repair protein ERCC-3